MIWVMKCSDSRQFSWPRFLHILLEGDAVDQLHDDIVHVAAAVTRRTPITMLGWDSMGDGLGLRVEPAAELLVLGQIVSSES